MRTIEESKALLDQATASAREKIRWADSSVRQAVGSALAADATVTAVIAEFEATRRRLGDLRGVMSVISSAFGLPDAARHWDSEPMNGYPAPSAAGWKEMIAALTTNPDAPLPELTS